MWARIIMEKSIMWEIREYFKNIFIIMVLLLPIYCLIRYKILKCKITDKKREIIMLIFLLYIVALTTQAVLPKFIIDFNGIHNIETGIHKLNLVPFRFLVDIYNETIIKGDIVFFLINIVGNTLLFVPLGFCIPLLWNVSYSKAMFIGFCYTLFIEVAQMFMPRVSDVDDLILNSIGVAAGVLLHLVYAKKKK